MVFARREAAERQKLQHARFHDGAIEKAYLEGNVAGEAELQHQSGRRTRYVENDHGSTIHALDREGHSHVVDAWTPDLGISKRG